MEGEASPEVEELEEESKIVYPLRTLRRLYLSIVNPVKAMAYVSYDPDLMIIPLMFILYAIFAFVQPFVMMSKLEIPSEVILNLPKVTVGDFKADFQKLIWSYSLTSYVLSTALTVIIILVASKIIIRDIQYKSIISGTMYSTVAVIIIGLIWLVLSFMTPGIAIPYRVHQNVTYLVWPSGMIDIGQPKALYIRANMTLPTVSEGATKSLVWSLNSTILPSNVSRFFVNSWGQMSIANREVSMQLMNQSSLRLQPGVPSVVLNLTATYLLQGGKSYLLMPDGEKIQVGQDTTMAITIDVAVSQPNPEDQIMFSSSIGNLTMIQPNHIIVVSNFSLPSTQKNQTYVNLLLGSRLVDSRFVVMDINVTAAESNEKNKASVQWRADSLLAQETALWIYFTQISDLQSPEPIKLVSKEIPIIGITPIGLITRVWQSVIALMLLKKSHEVSWVRATMVVVIQQGVLYFLRV